MPLFKSLIRLDFEKSWRMWDLNHGSSALKADALTTRSMRQIPEQNLNLSKLEQKTAIMNNELFAITCSGFNPTASKMSKIVITQPMAGVT